MKLLFQRGIFIGFIINVAIILAFALIADKRIHNYVNLQNLEAGKSEVPVRLTRIVSNVNTFGDNIKSFVITKDEKFLEFVGRETVNRDINYLKRNFIGNDSLLKKVIILEDNINERIQDNFRLIEAVKNEATMEEIRNISRDNLQHIRQVRAIISEITDETETIYENERTRLQKRESVLQILFILLLVLSVLLLVTVFFILRFYLKKRILSEIMLEENKHLLQSIIDNTSSAIFVKKLNGEYLLANKRFEKMFHPQHDNVTGKTDRQLFEEDLAARLRAGDMDVIKEGRELRFEEEIPHNGESYTYSIIKFPLQDAQGNAYAVAGIASDISTVKIEDTLLKESQMQFQALFDSAPDAIIVIDDESKIIKWNKKAESMFKWKEADVLGKSMPEIIMPERYRDKHNKGMKHFLDAGRGPILNTTIEVTALNKNKEEFDIELTISAIEIKGKYLFISFIRDITQRKQMEKETKRAKNFLDSIIENIPNMIFVKDAEELRFVRFNKAGEKLLGYKRNEMIGKNDYDFFPKKEADFFTEKDRQVLKEGILMDIREELVETKHGKRWLHTKKLPITDESGKPIYLLGISEDITEKKERENQRRETEKQLRENEMKLNMIIENIGEGIVVCDTNQRVILSNQMAEEILQTKELSSANWEDHYDIYYPDGHTVFPAQDLPLEKALKGASTHETELILHDSESNKKKLVKVTGQPIIGENNQVIAAVATIRDITKFRQLEAALEESEIKYRNLIGFRRNSKTEEKDG